MGEEDFKDGEIVEVTHTLELDAAFAVGDRGTWAEREWYIKPLKEKGSAYLMKKEFYRFKKVSKWDEATAKALKASIAHHEENYWILANYVGEFTQAMGNHFMVGKKTASFHAKDCALCKMFMDNDCIDCPLKKEQSKCEEGSHWYKISASKTRAEAIEAEANMIKVLKEVLGEETVKEKTINLYEMLKARIKDLKEWGKEADDIADIIYNSVHKRGNKEDIGGYFISVPICATHGGISVINHNGREEYFNGQYRSQSEKLSALKDALLWLLDHSNIPKIEIGSEVVTHLDNRPYKVRVLEEIKD